MTYPKTDVTPLSFPSLRLRHQAWQHYSPRWWRRAHQAPFVKSFLCAGTEGTPYRREHYLADTERSRQGPGYSPAGRRRFPERTRAREQRSARRSRTDGIGPAYQTCVGSGFGRPAAGRPQSRARKAWRAAPPEPSSVGCDHRGGRMGGSEARAQGRSEGGTGTTRQTRWRLAGTREELEVCYIIVAVPTRASSRLGYPRSLMLSGRVSLLSTSTAF